MRFVFLLLFAVFNGALAAKLPKVAVILSGGGARSIAYLGALQTLVEAGVPVDLILGTSGGALVGGLYASGYSFETIEKILNSLKPDDLIRPKFPPIDGLIDLSAFETVYREIVGNIKLEQTSPQLVVTATQLTPSDKSFIDKGDLTDAMRASISIPFLFAPAKFDGENYVDGGIKVLSSRSVQIAKDLGADFIIFIGPKREKKENLTLVDVLQLTLISVAEPEKTITADSSLTIKVDDAIFLDFSQTSPLLKRGRSAMKNELNSVLAGLKDKNVTLKPKNDPHKDNSINFEWENRVVNGLKKADEYQPFYLLPEFGIGPSSYNPNYRLMVDSYAWNLGVKAGIGLWQVSVGYTDLFRIEGASVYTNFGYHGDNFSFWATFDPLRRPIEAPWEAGISLFKLFSLTIDQTSIALQGQKTFDWHNLALKILGQVRFNYQNNWQIITEADLHYNFGKFFLQNRFSAAFSTTDDLYLGASSKLRAYPNGYLSTKSIGTANLDFGYILKLDNLLGLINGKIETKVFGDFAMTEKDFLWDLGVGFALDGRLFGLLNTDFGLDFSFAPDHFRINLLTELDF